MQTEDCPSWQEGRATELRREMKLLKPNGHGSVPTVCALFVISNACEKSIFIYKIPRRFALSE